MWKIDLITSSNRVAKSKKYESESSFLKWKDQHAKEYGNIYKIICYKRINNKWVNIEDVLAEEDKKWDELRKDIVDNVIYEGDVQKIEIGPHHVAELLIYLRDNYHITKK